MTDEISQQDIEQLIETANQKPLDIAEIAELLKDMWAWPDYVDYDGKTLKVSTGGWSEHERIIEELENTLFWFIAWQKSERGGHYTFHIEGDE